MNRAPGPHGSPAQDPQEPGRHAGQHPAPSSFPGSEPGRTPDGAAAPAGAQGERPGPLAEDAAQPADSERSGRERHHINPARMEVRVRRIALLGLVLVPLIYFIVQSLH